MSVLHQIIYSRTSRKSTNYLTEIIFRVSQKLLLKVSNPVVEANLYGFPFKVPFSHDLSKNLNKYPNYSWNLLKIAIWVNETYPNTPIIDIGANVGDTVGLLRTAISNPILCIEGSSDFFNLLLENISQFSQVEAILQLLGDANDAVKSELLIKNGTAQVKNSIKLLSIKTLISVLEEYPNYIHSKLVKIDTDGFDGFIVRGAVSWINEQKPYIFLEFDPFFLAAQGFPPTEIFDLFRCASYKLVVFFDNYGNYLSTEKIDNIDKLQLLVRKVTGFQGKRYYDLLFIPDENLRNFPYNN